jgi:hypothetical protein
MSSEIEIFQNKEQLIQKANEVAERTSEGEYNQSIFLYFIARYFVSLYEAKFGAIPIQVWNEYRNALDHFFRHLTNEESTHLKKMQGHLQRAVLDILKIYCHSVQEKVKKLKDEIDTEILKLVDNGEFFKNLNIDVRESENKFIKAKVQDNSLGDDSHTNQEIIGKYLDAVFSFDSIYKNVVDKTQDIDYAEDSYKAIHNDASKGTFWHHIKTHYIFYISWTILSFIIQFLYNNYGNLF